MSDKTFSLSRAIQQTIVGGTPTMGPERAEHFRLARENEATPFLDAYRAGNPRDRTLFAPLEVFLGSSRDLSAGIFGSGGALVGLQTFGRSDLQNWSACLRSGALTLSGLKSNVVLWQVSPLVVPTWLPEVGQAVPSDPGLNGPTLSPKRISAQTIVSKQLLAQQTNDTLDRILINDLSRQLGNYLDQSALYGLGSASNQPQGLVNTPGVQSLVFAADLNASFATAEAAIEAVNIDMVSYGTLVSPATKEKLKSTAAFSGGGSSVWEKLTRPVSSPEVNDNNAFCGCFSMMTFLFWGNSAEIIVNPYSLADSNRVQINATLLVNVGIRFPSAFGFGPVS